MNSKVKSVLDSILEQFKNGDNIPQLVALATFPTVNSPMHKWSLMNQLICYISESNDVRGYNQWKEVKRFVKKGAKSVHILVPWMKSKEEDNGDKKSFLAGFMTAPVFRVEDTDGEPLDYQQIELPKFPLMDRIKELGVDITAIPGNYDHYGYYSPSKKVIALASPEFCVLAHEATHLADEKVNGKLELGQNPLQEITAELGALALCQLVGLDGSEHLGNHYRYIESYAKKIDMSPYTALLKVISNTEKILDFLLKEESICIPQE
jgi:hypothetical protein